LTLQIYFYNALLLPYYISRASQSIKKIDEAGEVCQISPAPAEMILQKHVVQLCIAECLQLFSRAQQKRKCTVYLSDGDFDVLKIIKIQTKYICICIVSGYRLPRLSSFFKALWQSNIIL
jgi:hypothetical protein